MSLSSYQIVFVGVWLGAMVSFAIFSMLAMAHMQEEDQDRLEIELRQKNSLTCAVDHKGNPEPICDFVTRWPA